MNARHEVIEVLIADGTERRWQLEVGESATAAYVIDDFLRHDGLPTSWSYDYFLVAPDGDIIHADEPLTPPCDQPERPRAYVIGRRPKVHEQGSRR